MIVDETEERMVYQVTNGPGIYRVDLLANNGAGFCSCPDWSCRRQPNLNKGLPPLTTSTTCKHAIAALRHFNLSLLKVMAQEETR